MTSASWVQVVEVGSLIKKPIYMGSVHFPVGGAFFVSPFYFTDSFKFDTVNA
jgi:hypothetical protein